MKSEIVVIGGGASGLMAAYHAARTLVDAGVAAQVTVLEKMPRPARKVMITGKGRCNFTNVKDWNAFSGHVRSKPNFVKSAFYNLPSQAVVDWFEAFGMATVVERGDRAYPASYHASDVVDTLVNACLSLGVKIETDAEVSAITLNEAPEAVALENRSHPRLRKREGPADEVSGRGPAQQDVSGGWLPRSDKEAEVVSSTKIRRALEEGKVEAAEAMLGYAYRLRGVVVSGKQLGRTIGYPTANLRLYDPLKLIPARGVYLTEVAVLGRHHWGMTNVGDILETHIFDFDEDIYGLDLEVRFRRWLRPMRSFDSLDALKAQLAADEAACRTLLALSSPIL